MKKKNLLAILTLLIIISCTRTEKPVNIFCNNWAPSPLEPAFCLDDYIVWGGSVIKAEDGNYYMFASRWPKVTSMSSWVTNSEVVLAVSDKPEGPYDFVDVVLPSRGKQHWDGMATHNPTIRYYKGSYVLFYTGVRYDFDQPGEEAPTREQWEEAWNNKRIGVAVSESVFGPWERLDKPVLEPRENSWDASITSNPAPVLHDDGSVLLVYKSSPLLFPEQKVKNELNLGVAKADHYLGPYKRLNEDSQILISGRKADIEDPYVWFDGTYYNMIVKSMDDSIPVEWGSGFLAYSVDGSDWELADSPLAYTGVVQRTDGSILNTSRLERPQVLFQDGVPTHVFFACMENDIYNLVRPLNK